MIGFQEALTLIKENTRPMGTEVLNLPEAVERILAKDVLAKVDSPSPGTSLKDGYAVFSSDLENARPGNKITLKIKGFQGAGDKSAYELESGFAVRVTTGAVIPKGATAVLANEFTDEKGQEVICFADAEPGRNLLPRGADIASGQVLAHAGDKLHPALIGLLAASGNDRPEVYCRVRVSIISTGDEVVMPGQPLEPGQVYASNMMSAVGWLKSLGLVDVRFKTVPDHLDDITEAIVADKDWADAYISSGGAWQSQRDFMSAALEKLGWREVFHRLRMGPGKASGFGLMDDAPFFILSGGPPSYEIGLLTLALPGIMRMAGSLTPPFRRLEAFLEEPITGDSDWTNFIHGHLYQKEGRLFVRPVKEESRLISMAAKNSLIILMEECTALKKGDTVKALAL